ncbi:hypothetical protein R1flu_025717 [Riccia fluitans]|uniref:Uncharacterized protein n=1 Tax=Riccia fluitans TaxID=41844 RepID=A0ABD1XYJ4_9MARC
MTAMAEESCSNLDPSLKTDSFTHQKRDLELLDLGIYWGNSVLRIGGTALRHLLPDSLLSMKTFSAFQFTYYPASIFLHFAFSSSFRLHACFVVSYYFHQVLLEGSTSSSLKVINGIVIQTMRKRLSVCRWIT